MEYRKPARLLVLLLLLGSGALNAAESPRIYRYRDNNGQLVFNSFIPAEFAKNGYTILNQKGRVLEEIPRTRTREELAAQTASEEKRRREEEARIARREADNVLLRLYRTPADIERKRDLHLAEFDVQIAAKVAKLEQLDAEIAQFQQQADSAELAELQTDREALDAERVTLAAEREQAAHGFDEDIERLSYLQGLAKNTAAE